MRDVIAPLFEDWQLMQRFNCTKAELDAMDALEVHIFKAFMRGEWEGAQMKRDMQRMESAGRR